jgi:hypothetical protein
VLDGRDGDYEEVSIWERARTGLESSKMVEKERDDGGQDDDLVYGKSRNQAPEKEGG